MVKRPHRAGIAACEERYSESVVAIAIFFLPNHTLGCAFQIFDGVLSSDPHRFIDEDRFSGSRPALVQVLHEFPWVL